MQYRLKVCSTGWGCAVQAEGVQYRLRVCSTGWECAVRAKGLHYGLRHTRSAGWERAVHPEGNSLFCIPQSVLRVCFSVYCTPSACTAGVPQPVLRICLNLYCTISACNSGLPQSVLHPQPELHTLSLYCRYFAQGIIFKPLVLTICKAYKFCLIRQLSVSIRRTRITSIIMNNSRFCKI